MTGGRLVTAFMMMLACSGVACTAIVLSKLEPISDYGLDEGGSRSSSSSSSSGSGDPLDDCSLRATSSRLVHRNDCERCIEDNCSTDVDYACDTDASATTKKPWFTRMKTCAQNPWFAHPEPDSGTSISNNWGCRHYVDAGGELAGNDDVARERRSERCINSSCMQGTEPKCYLCEITHQKPGTTGEIAYLRDDECGKCILENCNEDIIACCNSSPVEQYVELCSFTAEDSNREKCAMLVPENVGDGGAQGGMKLSTGGWSTSDRVCAVRLSTCIKNNCTDKVAKCRFP